MATASTHLTEVALPLSEIEGSKSDKRRQQESLEAAFQFFNETSAQLANSYQMLEARVQHLTRELNEVEQERSIENQAKEKIENRMQALLNFLPGGVIVLDSKGIIIEANPAAEVLLDTSLENRVWRQVIQECFAPRNDDGFEVSTRTGKRISISTSSINTDGQIILITDQTETRRLQDNLSRFEKLSAMGKMVSALAHQIRTPLSAAMLYAGHICNPSLDETRREVFSEKLYGRLQHMEKQVRDMMLFVKNELPLNDEISVADLEDGLKQAAELPLHTTSSHCEWINSCSGALIKCNREALISAIMNLINNSIQASEEPARLTVSISLLDTDKIVLTVADQGPGMSADALVKAKELFYTTKSQGTGLGIAVVQSVTKAHGGYVDIESEEGVGTQAHIILPLSERS